jgi:ssDNA-binding Zn-finger/Zn-ribbon topoisomerase 1
LNTFSREVPLLITVSRKGDTEVLKLKSCPRCKKGDIALDRDHHGWYEYCIQCGYVRDLISMVELEQPACGRKKRQRKSKTSREEK